MERSVQTGWCSSIHGWLAWIGSCEGVGEIKCNLADRWATLSSLGCMKALHSTHGVFLTRPWRQASLVGGIPSPDMGWTVVQQKKALLRGGVRVPSATKKALSATPARPRARPSPATRIAGMAAEREGPVGVTAVEGAAMLWSFCGIGARGAPSKTARKKPEHNLAVLLRNIGRDGKHDYYFLGLKWASKVTFNHLILESGDWKYWTNDKKISHNSSQKRDVSLLISPNMSYKLTSRRLETCHLHTMPTDHATAPRGD